MTACPSSYKSRLSELKLLPLMYWFEIQDIKSLKEPSDNFNIRSHQFVTGRTRFSCNNKLTVQAKHYTAQADTFTSIVSQNLMPTTDISATPTLDLIKNTLHSTTTSGSTLNKTLTLTTHACTYHLMCPCNRCSYYITHLSLGPRPIFF